MPAMPISCSRSVLRANSLLVLIAISATTLLLSNSREPPAFAQTSVSAVDVVIPWSGEPENDHSGANRDDGILKYELRSIVKNMNWVRTIFIFADPLATPRWLFEFGDRVKVVNRCEVFINAKMNCPTQNTFAVYANLHRIRGLSERYIICDDDVLITGRLSPEHFFSGHGIVIQLGDEIDLYPSSFQKGGKNYITELKTDTSPGGNHVLPTRLPRQRSTQMHTAWPCLRSEVFRMQRSYLDWFNFVSSHRSRFCFLSDTLATSDVERGNKNGACFQENSFWAIMWFISMKGKVFKPRHHTPADTVTYEDISQRQLEDIIRASSFTLNINDPVVLRTADIMLLEQGDKNVSNLYTARRNYIHETLERLFPPLST